MNLQQLNSALPKPWLNINCNSLNVEAKIDSFEVDAVNVKTDALLLDQNVVVGVPPVGFSLVYADNTDRLKVASQALPTQTIAYVSDVPANDKIISPDLSASVECQNGGIIQNVINGDNRLTIDADLTYKDPALVDRLLVLSGGYSSVRSSAGASTRLDIDVTNIYAELQGAPVLYILGDRSRIWSPNGSTLLNIQDSAGVQINGSYYLPTAGGSLGQVITNDGAGGSSWQNIPVAPPSWVNSYYDPALGSVTNVPLGAINNFTEVNAVLTLQQSGALWDSPSNGRLRYIGADPIICSVNYLLSTGSSLNNQNLISRLYLSGVPIVGTTCWLFTGNAIAVQNSSVTFTLNMVSGDYLSIFVTNNTTALTVAQVNSTNISINIL